MAEIKHTNLRIRKIDPDTTTPLEDHFDTPEAYNQAVADWHAWREALGDDVAYFADIEIFDRVPLQEPLAGPRSNGGLTVSLQTAWLPDAQAVIQLGDGIAQQLQNLFSAIKAPFPEVPTDDT